LGQQPNHHAFTSTSDTGGLLNRLINDVLIIGADKKLLNVKALWDTGATNTCISKEAAAKLSLIAVSKTTMHSASEASIASVYKVNIGLPNGVMVENVAVAESNNICTQGFDLLIGMDIILLGDFAVSNYNGQTMFSFRFPSIKHTDYVQQINATNKIGPRHGTGTRNMRK
jgi:hypothetical protein